MGRQQQPDQHYQPESFLGGLLKKKAMVLSLQEAGVQVTGALTEVERQIQQVLNGNILSGEGVTKSCDKDS
jgi:hypothetical protein